MNCLAFWGEDGNNFGHVSPDNGSMATMAVIPLFTMELRGYPLGLADTIQRYYQIITQLREANPKARYTIEQHPALQASNCKKCLYRQDWLRINGHCVHCYVLKHLK